MADLEPKLRFEPQQHTARSNQVGHGISPRLLHAVLSFFEQNDILLSGFLHTLLSCATDSRDAIHSFAIDDLQKNLAHVLSLALEHPSLSGTIQDWVYATATAGYVKEVQFLSGSATGWHFTASKSQASQFSDFSMASLIQTATNRAPRLWELCDSVFAIGVTAPSVTQENKGNEFQFKKDVRKVACIANIVNSNNQRCNLLQVVNGIFLHTCNAPERAIDLFSRLGLCCSQQTILGAVDSLSRECTREITKAGQSLLVAYAYDNFDMADKSKTPVVEESHDGLRHLTSGTLIPLHFAEARDLTSARAFWDKSRFNDVRTITALPRSLSDLFMLHPEELDHLGMTRQDKFNAWRFRRDLFEYGPVYFKKFLARDSLPDFVEKVPLFKTRQVPAKAMDIPNSSVDGNIATIESLLRQGGVLNTDGATCRTGLPDLDDYFMLFHGDLGTGERIQSAQIRRSLESTPARRLQCVVFVPGLFHIKMACADALWRIFLQTSAARSDETSFFALLSTLRPGETSRIANGTAGYQVFNECITHIGRAERLGWWEQFVRNKIPNCTSLDDFAERQPTMETIVKYSNDLSGYASTQNLEALRSLPGDQRDQQHENVIHRSVYLLLYEETAHAIRSGDVGRVETCLREWIPIFKAVGKHKYSTMLLQFLTDVHFEYPPPLKKTIRYNWFCNLTGREMRFQGVDWLVELNNMLTKTIYGGQGSNNTVERVIKESVLIQLYRDVIHVVEKQFGLTPKLTRHGEPDMSATYAELRRLMHNRNSFVPLPGRRTAHSTRDAFEDGMHKISTETNAMSNEILSNSNETEHVATDDDIITELI